MIKSTQFRAIALLSASNEQGGTAEELQTLIRDYAVVRGMEIVGFLALDPENLILGMRHAIESAKVLGATTIIIDDIATLMLPPPKLINVIDNLVRNKLTLAIARNNSSFDQTGLITLRDLIAITKRAEGALHSERIKDSLQVRKKRGQRVGGQKFGLGLNEGQIVEQILQLHAEGKSLQGICHVLELTDTKTVHNKKWHPTTIKRIIARSKR